MPVNQTAATSAGPVPPPPPPLPPSPALAGSEISPLTPKPSPFAARLPIYPGHSETLPYFQDPRAHLSYEAPPYPQTGEGPAQEGCVKRVPNLHGLSEGSGGVGMAGTRVHAQLRFCERCVRAPSFRTNGALCTCLPISPVAR